MWRTFDSMPSDFEKCARVLRDHEQRFGLEYVGPKTSWTAKRYPFVHSMAETKELIAEIGTATWDSSWTAGTGTRPGNRWTT